MKKVLLYAFLSTVFVFSNTMMANAKPCPVHSDCSKSDKLEKTTVHYSPCRFMSESQKKVMAAKKEEFKKRLNITDEQKAELEKIKAHEQKALVPYKKKIEKEEEKLKDLFLKEHEIRIMHSKQFEALLTPEQKAELQKFKTETIQEMMKIAPPVNMFNESEQSLVKENDVTDAELKKEDIKSDEEQSAELNCTCKKQDAIQEDNVKKIEEPQEPIPEPNEDSPNRKDLKIKGTPENILKEASTEDYDSNEKNISKFVKENVADEDVESVAPNEELQPKCLERKVVEPTLAPTPIPPTVQEEINLEK